MRSRNVILALFAALVISGLLLMLVYVPSAAPVRAETVPAAPHSWGHFLRGVHFWAGNLVVLAVLAHLLHTIFVKTNWSRVGGMVALFLLTGLLWFTGVLLPWDQLGLWLSPLADPYAALCGVYRLHALILPLLILPLLWGYVRQILRSTQL